MKRVFIVKGRKWRDKVNGNTYNSAIIVDVEADNVIYIPFAYGYGSDYYERAIKEIKKLNGGEIDYKKTYIYNAGADYDLKTNVKNHLY